jgi:hypothetical protein
MQQTHVVQLERSTSSADVHVNMGNLPGYGTAHLHHGRGLAGQLDVPQTKGTASPSAIRISPTSRPRALKVPHLRP